MLKIAEHLELSDIEGRDAFAIGMEAFIKQAELNEAETADFLDAAKAIKVAAAQEQVVQTAFEGGFMKFAADADLTHEEFLALRAAAQAYSQK